MTDAQVYAGAALIGAVAGMRAMSAPVIVSQIARSGDIGLPESKLGFLNRSSTASAMTVLAAGEFIADKLPFIPARTKAGPLIARAISGGLSGAAISSAKKKSAVIGAVLGAVGAIGASYAAYHLRRAITERFELPDTIVAVVEDTIVAGTSMFVTSRLREQTS